jgi:hypothetical protein
MSAKELKDHLRGGCVQVFVPVVHRTSRSTVVLWIHTTQREARYLRTELKGELDIASPHWTLDQVLAARCGGGKILRLVPRSLRLSPNPEMTEPERGGR